MSSFIALKKHLNQHIIGQQALLESLLVGLLCDGHILIEGMPGLAKTTAIKALAQAIEGEFQRIQFTPDLLPADVVGTEIYQHDEGSFKFRAGPLFHHIVLADEINRAPPKVQSALLEAMAERQITVGHQTYALPPLFMVLATQNPVEQEGTYPLPEAQLDRFLLHTIVDYPSRDEELAVLALMEQEVNATTPRLTTPILTQAELFEARQAVNQIYLAPKLKEYCVDLVRMTREPQDADLKRWRRFGASPRATLALARCARAVAWLNNENYVTPEHIQAIAPSVLRHRVVLSFEAEADGISINQFIQRLLEFVAVP